MDILAGAPNTALLQIGKAADDKTRGTPKGFEVGYELFSINGRMRGHGDPIRVKYGERVLFHILNASATEIRSLALPGHVFRVVALDGNPVPAPSKVPVLWLGTAERVSAIVEMTHPGVWTMGDLSDDDRRHGMGIVVEYGNRKGAAQWVKPHAFRWDYTHFGNAGATTATPDETIPLPPAAPHGLWLHDALRIRLMPPLGVSAAARLCRPPPNRPARNTERQRHSRYRIGTGQQPPV